MSVSDNNIFESSVDLEKSFTQDDDGGRKSLLLTLLPLSLSRSIINKKSIFQTFIQAPVRFLPSSLPLARLSSFCRLLLGAAGTHTHTHTRRIELDSSSSIVIQYFSTAHAAHSFFRWSRGENSENTSLLLFFFFVFSLSFRFTVN